jgi:hypothetical protein
LGLGSLAKSASEKRPGWSCIPTASIQMQFPLKCQILKSPNSFVPASRLDQSQSCFQRMRCEEDQIVYLGWGFARELWQSERTCWHWSCKRDL